MKSVAKSRIVNLIIVMSVLLSPFVVIPSMSGDAGIAQNNGDLGQVMAFPDIWIGPEGFDIITMAGNTSIDDLTIGNTGPGDLHYNITIGEPDPNNYTLSEPAPYWLDGVTGGTNLSLSDDDHVNRSLPFTFDFYAEQYNNVNICSNGWVSFSNASGAIPGSIVFPTTSWPNTIMVLGDDWYPSNASAGVYVKQFNSPNRFVITWHNMPHYGSGGSNDFQIVLYSDGKIDLNYGVLESADGWEVALNKGDGILATEYDGPLPQNKTLRFIMAEGPSSWLSAYPDNGTVGTMGETNVSVNANASLLAPGFYRENLTLFSNDPDEPEIIIPVNCTVLSAPHDIRILGIDVPIQGEAGKTVLINATILNQGTNNETNIEIHLLIDGNLENNTVISGLNSGTRSQITLTWKPMSEVTFTVEIYAVPVPGETEIANNRLNATMEVTAECDIWTAPRNIDFMGMTGEVFSEELTIGNSGLGILEYQILGGTGGTKDVLVYVEYSDMGANDEYENTLSAIDQVTTDYTTTLMYDNTQLDSEITGKDILLIPEQESASYSTMVSIGSSWSSVLNAFLDRGGVIVTCDYTGSSYGIYVGAGFMAINGSYDVSGDTIYVTDAASPLAAGVASSFTAPDGSRCYDTAEPGEVIGDQSYPVVLNKPLRSGNVILIGFDYFELTQSDANKVVGNSVAHYGHSTLMNWLTVSSNNGSIPPGDQKNITVYANASILPPGFYRENLSVISEDPDEPWIDIPINFTVLSAPHDIRVLSIDVPERGEAGTSIPINATILNQGTNNETNIEIRLLVDGNIENNTIIGILDSGIQHEITLSWKPMTETTFTVEIYAVPVTGESGTANNRLNDTIKITAEADIWITPAAWNATALCGSTVSYNITIGNKGLGDLSYNISADGPSQYPLGENSTRALPYFNNSGLNIGYRFQAKATEIYVRRLGRNIPTDEACWVTLWSDDGNILAQELVGGGTDWQWVDIQPVALTQDHYYRLSVMCNWSYYYDAPWSGDANVDIVSVVYSWGSKDDFPTDEFIDYLYGIPDIGYTIGLMEDWLSVLPDNGYVASDGQENVTLVVNATELEPGHYKTNLSITSNDPQDNFILVPIDLIVHSPPLADAGKDVTVDQHTSVIFDGSRSTDDKGVINWSWTFEYNGSFVTLYEENPDFTFHSAGYYPVILTVWDADENDGSDVVNITVRDITAPIARAGPDRHVGLGDMVTLNGTGSSDNVGIVDYTWLLVYGGSEIELYGSISYFIFDIPGSYPIMLHVRDVEANWNWDITTVHVRGSEVPIADAGDDITIGQHENAKFNASESWDDGGIKSYEWSFVYNGYVQYLYGISPNYTFHHCGRYNISLKVADTEDNWDVDHLLVVVNDTTPPQADAGNDIFVDQGYRVYFDASGSVDNDFIVSFDWNFIYDHDRINLSGESPNFTFDIPGAYLITLEVTDPSGHTGLDTVTVDVKDNERPMLLADNSGKTGTTGDRYIFNMAVSDNAGVSSVLIDWNHGEIMALTALADPENDGIWKGMITLHDVLDDLRYTVNITDTYDNNNLSQVTIVPVVDNDPPVADAGPNQVTVQNREIFLDSMYSRDNVGIANYTWRFDYDGSERSLHGSRPRFSFAIPGNYTIRLAVTDSSGNVASDRLYVNVIESGGDDGGSRNGGGGEGSATGGFFSSTGERSVMMFLIILVVGLLLFVRKKGEGKGKIIDKKDRLDTEKTDDRYHEDREEDDRYDEDWDEGDQHPDDGRYLSDYHYGSDGWIEDGGRYGGKEEWLDDEGGEEYDRYHDDGRYHSGYQDDSDGWIEDGERYHEEEDWLEDEGWEEDDRYHDDGRYHSGYLDDSDGWIEDEGRYHEEEDWMEDEDEQGDEWLNGEGGEGDGWLNDEGEHEDEWLNDEGGEEDELYRDDRRYHSGYLDDTDGWIEDEGRYHEEEEWLDDGGDEYLSSW